MSYRLPHEQNTGKTYASTMTPHVQSNVILSTSHLLRDRGPYLQRIGARQDGDAGRGIAPDRNVADAVVEQPPNPARRLVRLLRPEAKRANPDMRQSVAMRHVEVATLESRGNAEVGVDAHLVGRQLA